MRERDDCKQRQYNDDYGPAIIIMKKLITVFVFALFVGSMAMAVAPDMASADQAEIAKVKTYISSLEVKLSKAPKAKKAAIATQLKGAKARLAKLEAEAAVEAMQAPAAPRYVAPAPSYTAPMARPMLAKSTPDWALEGNLGAVAGILGVNGALRYNIPTSWFGMSGWSVRGGAGFATGTISGATRRAVTVFGDALVALPAEWTGGIESYVGGGLNYPATATGGSGQLGGQAFVGVQTADPLGMGGKMYLEVGYGVLRGKAGTFSAKSVTALVGWTYPLAF